MSRFIAFVTAALATSQALAVIRHPDAFETSNGDPAGPSNWFAKYNSNASGIAIGPNHILTARHQGGGIGATINFPTGPNTGSYSVIGETTFGSGVDLRIVTISQTLPTYATLYSGSTVGQTALIGGFGPTRTNPNYVNGSNQLVGYGVSTPAGNSYSLLFGQNRIDSLDSSASPWANTPLLVADFDGPENVTPTYSGIAPAATNKVDYEAALGEGDSGGGWFINVAGTWKLVGLSHGADLVRINGGTVNPYNGTGSPAFLFGGQIAAVDLTPYYSSINAVVPEPSCVAILAAAGLALRRTRRR